MPKFCQFCGSLMKDSKKFSDNSWFKTLVCLKCKSICEVTFGDMMGGADFCHTYWKKVEKLK